MVKKQLPWPFHVSRYYYPFPPVGPMLYHMELSIGGQQFIGKGRTRQLAKHDAAAKALKVLHKEPILQQLPVVRKDVHTKKPLCNFIQTYCCSFFYFFNKHSALDRWTGSQRRRTSTNQKSAKCLKLHLNATYLSTLRWFIHSPFCKCYVISSVTCRQDVWLAPVSCLV